MPPTAGPSHKTGGSSTMSFGSDEEGEALPRKSQRQPQSCTECTRRKTRCDKGAPCGNCVKRGKSSECRIEVTVKPVTISTRAIAQTAQQEVKQLRLVTTQTSNRQEHRINTLENLVAQLASQLESLRTSGGGGTQLPSSFGKMEAGRGIGAGRDFSAGEEGGMVGDAGEEEAAHDELGEAASVLELLAMGRSRGKTTGALVGGALQQTRPSSGDDGDEEMVHWNENSGEGSARMNQNDYPRHSEPHHASTSQRRLSDASSSSAASGSSSASFVPDEHPQPHPNSTPSYPPPPRRHQPQQQQQQAQSQLPNLAQPLLPFPPRLISQKDATAPSPSTPSSSTKEVPPRRGAMSKIPSEAAGRRLVQYEMEMVAWIHCGYWPATLAAECEIFWEEGATGEVEVNRNWLALYFAVLASSLHHMPVAESQKIFPGENIQALVARFFDGSVSALTEAQWMSTHSLYSTQTLLVLVSPANHLGRGDWYLSAAAVGIRIAQALQINWLGEDSYPAAEGMTLSPMDPNALVLREMCKRIWYQLVAQDWLHLPFNRTSVISAAQFNTAVPLHCTDDSLLDPSTLRSLSIEVPTLDSHTGQLLKLAVQVHKLFDGFHATKIVPYSLILQADAETAEILQNAPSWMQWSNDGRPNPLPSNAPPWLEWQSKTFLISAAHKIIILHRPYLGRAFSDPKFQKSRDACVLQACRILQVLRECQLEEFRKTWTNLTHSVAAAVILILEFSHTSTENNHGEEPLRLVVDAIEIFRSLRSHSTIAEKGVRVLTAFLEEQLRKHGGVNGPGSLKRKATGEVELEKAIKALRKSTPVSSPPIHQPTPPRPPPTTHSTSYQQQAGSSSQGYSSPMVYPHHQQQYLQQQQLIHNQPHLPSFMGPLGGMGAQGGTWSPHPYHPGFSGPSSVFGGQGGGGGGGGNGGGQPSFDQSALFEGLEDFELSGLLQYENGLL
ncbi:hypothetical protein BDY24DRAFT_379292 [Mrakia frigida]|uniref:Zn(II)2Cys6 transcription factor n=1 Tax=Mrakia frigida TaxID=29902 RepID=UPI003FCC10EE